MQRYRAGQAPVLAGTKEAEASHHMKAERGHVEIQEAGMSSIERRLARLNENTSSEPSSDRARRRTHRAEVVVESEPLEETPSRSKLSTGVHKRTNDAFSIQPVQTASHADPEPSESQDMELDEEHVAQRRADLREMLLAKQEERFLETEALAASGRIASRDKWNGEEEESYEEEDEEDEEDSESEEAVEIERPKFMKKSERRTLVDEEALILQQEEERAREAAAEQLRREQTKEMMAQEEAKEEEAKMDLVDGNISDIEKNDDPDEEFELWKIRELKRLKRDRDAETKLEFEREGVEARKKMTDAQVLRERREEARRARQEGEQDDSTKTRSLKPMQRYYHKGAFFQDKMEELSKNHDWNAPTGADNWFNRTTGPESLKTKRYGASASTKGGSLKDQDTTRKSSPPYRSRQ